jgi:hypothetical protein
MVPFLGRKGYTAEADYIRVICNWRRACDKSELQKGPFNYQFLNYILDELIEWHKEFYDFSLLEGQQVSIFGWESLETQF